jgi:hypothetical protein
MITFFEFFEILKLEAAEIAKDLGEFKITHDGMGTYQSSFTHESKPITVYFNKSIMEDPFFSKDSSGKPTLEKLSGYEISFKGTNDFLPTGDAGGDAFSIYGKVLAVVKKFLAGMGNKKPNPVQFIKFMGFDPKMSLIYERFVKKYLGNTYTRIDAEHLVRNDVIDAVRINTQGASDATIQTGQESHTKFLDQIRQAKRKPAYLNSLEAPESEKSMPWYMAKPTQYQPPTKGKKNVQQKQPAL